MGRSEESFRAGACIVGNCPEFIDHAKVIDRGEWVTRFNNTTGFGKNSGFSISELVLVSRGGQAAEWIEDPEFATRPAITNAKLITLVFPRTDDPGAECWFNELHRLLSELGKSVNFITEEDHAYAREALTTFGAPSDKALSSGFVYCHSKLRELAVGSPPLQIFGFSFEGWDGHAWGAEAEWFKQKAAEGRLTVHPVHALVQSKGR